MHLAFHDHADLEPVGDSEGDIAATGLGDDRSARVVSFLAKLRGLGHLDDQNLDEQLHGRRFEILQLREELGGDEDSRLPSRLPSHRDIHNEVLYGKTPKIHQIVAHVLYPDQVPWPKNQDPPTTEVMFSQTSAVDESTTGQANASDSLRNKSSRDGVRRSQNNVAHRNEELQQDIDQHKAELSKGLLWLQRKRSAGGGSNGQRTKNGKSPRSGGMEIELRGQRLNSTVKGYACIPVTEESLAVAASGVNDGTRQERIEIEREAKLEAFKEKKLLEKIKELETAKENELKLQEEIQMKEANRRQRNAALKKKIEKDVQKKFEQEREEAEKKKKDKEKADAERKKEKQYHETQKDKLADWWHQKNESEFMCEPMKSLFDKPKKRTPREKNQQQKEAEENVRHRQWAMEERPPLPPGPRAHDLKAPPLTERDVRSLKSAPMSWEVTAKTVSGAYGLTKKEYNGVTERTVRGVTGAGRMATYDL
jgi:hypothetical protein